MKKKRKDHQREAPVAMVLNSTENTPELPTMEVHHHGHVHHEKKWKEYLFQFFMLFLAVFCGFLAEYQLEHVIENKREKQYMVSLLQDLQGDTAQLGRIKASRLRKLSQLDSALAYFTAHDGNTIPLRLFRQTTIGLRSFYQNSGTIDQLKNAGGLRLIHKRNVVDSIEAYDAQIRRMVLRDQYETNVVYDYNQTLGKMFDGKMLAKLYADTAIHHNPSPSPETLIQIDTQYTGQYLNELLSCRSGVQANLSLQNTIASQATNLIRTIKEEYDLK